MSRLGPLEAHPNGHDYLVCGEVYQGQTVVELDTGKRRDHLPDEAKDGVGFCWTDMRFEPSAAMLVVEGCIWACPYEFRFFDFADPMSGWPEIEAPTTIDADRRPPVLNADGAIVCYRSARASEARGDEAETAPTGFVTAVPRLVRGPLGAPGALASEGGASDAPSRSTLRAYRSAGPRLRRLALRRFRRWRPVNPVVGRTARIEGARPACR